MAGQAPSVMKLFSQLQKGRAKLAAQGASVPQTHPSLISRVFDVISRPNYAAANTYKAVIDKINQNKAAGQGGDITQLPGILAKGFTQGIEGKAKTRFSDVIQAGSPHANPWVRTFGGLAGDVGLDPSSYVGVGLTKALPAFEETAAAGKAIQGTQQALGARSKLTDLSSAAQTARDVTRASKPGSLSLKIAGQPVASSERAYSALKKVTQPLQDASSVQTANRLLRTAGTYPGRLKTMLRVPEARGIATYTDFEKELMTKYGRKVSPEDAVKVSKAIEAGVPLHGTISRGGLDLGHVQDEIKGWIQHYDQIEAQNGIARATHGAANYVPKKFASTVEYQQFKKMISKSPNHIFSLDELKAAGLHPHENALDLIRLRAAEAERAVARATYKNGALDATASVFKGRGKQLAERTAADNGLVKLEPKYLKNTRYAGQEVHVPEEVARSFHTLDTLHQSEEDTAKFLRFYDRAARTWKTGVTTINPSHHMKNIAGDAFLAWEGGLRDPLAFKRSVNILRNHGSMKVGDLTVDSVDLHGLYKDTGGQSGFFNTELVGGTTPGAASEMLSRPFNAAQERLRHLVGQREDFTRLASWTDQLRKYADQYGVHSQADLRKAAEAATEHVKKFHFDYGDLTRFETQVRRAVPFYTFMRKNLPLQAEMLALNPGRLGKVPKDINALQQLLGTDSGHLPINEIIPAYIKDMAAVRGGGQGGDSIVQKLLHTSNPVYLDPQLPLSQAAQMFTGSPGDIIRRASGQTVARPIIELGTHVNTLTGQQMSPSIGQYAINQFPITRTINNAINPPRPQRVIQPGENFGNPLLKVLDLFNPVGVKEVTNQSQLSELRRQQDPVQARLRKLRRDRINRALGTG